MEEEEKGARKLLSLMEKATSSTDPDVDPLLLKSISTRVRYSQSELRLAAQTLIDNMKRPHSQIRYLSLLIIDHLFMRSVVFRTIISDHLDHLLSLSVGFRRHQPLPPPSSVASLLRSKSIELLEKWYHSFGLHYRHLRLGYDYLKNNLKLRFPNLHSNQTLRRERDLRTQQLLRDKFQSLRDNLPSIMEEIHSTIDEIMRCLEIARSNDEGDLSMEPLDDADEDQDLIHNPELRQIRLDSLLEGEKVHENSDNKAVFDVLRELYKLLLTKHLVTVQQCLSLLIRVEVEVDDTRFRDSTLKHFIDLRNKVLAAKAKCEESRCALPHMTPNREDDDDVIWEEAKLESSKEPKRNVKPTSTSKVEHVLECSSNARVNSVKKTGEDRKHDSDPNSLRSKLLGEAPVVKWGSSLDNWGGNKDVLANHRGLELDSHWGRVDYDAVIPADKIAQLNVQATIYKEEQAEIQPCRAPLHKGGLCPRRDLKVCPFHGPILLRDDQGKPILPLDCDGPPSVERKSMSQTPSMEEVDLDDESVLAQQVAKQAVKNVRERDTEDAKKKAIDKRAVKRAKLAQVRQHNEMVLREAAMTSTSRSASIGEIGSDRTCSAKNKKPTLASMLRKKVTTKDRLAQKLLNSRARDSTVKQLTLGEDANYRESFPNQW